MNNIKYESQYDKMTKMPVSKLIFLLGIPSTLTMLITNIYNMVDTYYVGKIGTSASGAVGIVFGIMAILQATGFLFGHGAGSIISRLLGKKEEERANIVASISIFCAFTGGFIIAVLGFLFMKPLMFFMGSTKTIYPYAREYASCIFVAAPFIVSSFSLNNILRYQGNATYGLVGIGIGAVLNIVLDPIFMFYLDYGILGAGIATALSQVIGFFVLFGLFQSKKTQCSFNIKNVKYIKREFLNISYTGLPSLVRQGLSSISTMLLNQQAAVYGDAAVAAMSIVGRISMFIFAVGLGIGQGFQPVAGFNYGAKKYDRVKKGFRFTFISGEAILGVFAFLGILVSGSVVGIFRDDPLVIEIGSRALLFQCIAIFFSPFFVCTNMLLQSTGKSGQASVTALLKNGLCFMPLIITLPKFWGILGIQLAQPIADIMTFFISIPFAICFFKELKNKSQNYEGDN